MKGLKTYRLRAVIHHPDNEDAKHEYNYLVNFFQDENGYGNKTYMQLATEDHKPFKYFDLRYNNVYDSNAQISFICMWADAYWNGKDGSWKLESIEVKHAE